MVGGKFGETCPMCKQFRMMCMCGIGSEKNHRVTGSGGRPSADRALVLAQSLAVWRIKARRPRSARRGIGGPSRESR